MPKAGDFLFNKMSGPTADDLSKVKCPVDKPFVCAPFGKCYDVYSFCSKRSRAVEPCFPHSLPGAQPDRLAWCLERLQETVSSLPDPTCRMGCEIIINSQPTHIPQLNNSTVAAPHKEMVVVVYLITIWFSIGMIVGALFIFRRFYLRFTYRTTLKGHIIRRAEESSRRDDECYAENSLNEDQEQFFELQQRTYCDSSNMDGAASLKFISEKPHRHSSTEALNSSKEDNHFKIKIREAPCVQRSVSMASVNDVYVHRESMRLNDRSDVNAHRESMRLEASTSFIDSLQDTDIDRDASVENSTDNEPSDGLYFAIE